MKLLILAGGFGTRLKPSLNNIPKALAPIGDTPFLMLQIKHWVAQGLRDFTFLLHHQADQIIDFLVSQKFKILSGCRVNWLVEPIPMDTGGAIAFAVNKYNLKVDFLSTNADTWLDGGIKELMHSSSPTIGVVKLPDVGRYGQVYLDKNNYVTAFVEKGLDLSSGWINAGINRLSPKLFKDWNGKPFSLERDLFVRLVKIQMLKALPLQNNFTDIGVPEDYQKFCRSFNEI